MSTKNKHLTVPPRQDRRGFGEFFALSGVLVVLSLLGFAAEWQYRLADRSLIPSIISIIFGFVGVIGFITAEGSSRPPHNDPSQFIQREIARGKRNEDEKVLVCLGDSLTHGACSANWVDEIKAGMAQQQQQQQQQQSNIDADAVPLAVVNAAQNSICTHTVLKERVDHAVMCRPDFVFILIGSNDVMSIYRNDWALIKTRMWHLPERPTENVLVRNLTNIVKELLDQTNARIAVGTLPPMGEDIDNAPNTIIQRINRRIRDIGYDFRETKRVTVVDLNGALWAGINSPSRRATGTARQNIHSVDNFLIAALIIDALYYALGLSWTTLSRLITGNIVLTDSLHLNEIGGDIVKDEVVSWLVQNDIVANFESR